MAAPTVERVRLRVGFATQNSVKISVVTFNNTNPVSVTCSGGTIIPRTATALGNADDLCNTGVVEITGLSAGRTYTGTMQQGASEVISFSFKTQPSNNNFNIFGISCAKHNPQPTGSIWKVLRDNVVSRSPTAIAHIDDLGYFDTLRVGSFSSIGDTATGTNTGSQDPETGLGQRGVPVDTGAGSIPNGQDDYIIAWMAWYGMFPQWFTYPGKEDYEWCMRNVAHWDQLGDHEYYPDARSHVRIGAVGGAESGQIPNIDSFAQVNWDAFVGDAGPPRTSFTGGTAAWAFECGNVAFASPDFISQAQCYNAMDTGDTGSRGAADSGWYIADVSDSTSGPDTWKALYGETPAGWTGDTPGATIPARTSSGSASNNVNHATDDTPPDYLGTTQAGELATFFTGSSAKSKVLLSAKRITAHNQPWYDLHPDEWLAYIDTILNNDACNGTNGHYFHTAGDVHAFAVTKYTADGSTAGLGSTNLTDNQVLYEFLCGTVSSAVGSFGKTLAQGAALEFERTVAGLPDDARPQIPYSAFNEMRFSSTGVEVEYIKLPQSTPMTQVYELLYTQNNNSFNVQESPVPFFGIKDTTPTALPIGDFIPANQQNTTSVNDAFVSRADTSVYGPALGGEQFDTSYINCGSENASSTTVQLAVYEYAFGVSGALRVTDRVALYDAITVLGTGAEPNTIVMSAQLSTPYTMIVDRYYVTAAAAGSANLGVVQGPALDNSSRNNAAGLPLSWDTDDYVSLVARNYSMWTDLIDPSSDAPTLTTPYSNRINLSGDVVSAINFAANWSGATSVTVTTIPNGLTDTSGSVAGTIAAPTGTFITNIAATNSSGTTNAKFQWTILTTGDPTSGINVAINKTI